MFTLRILPIASFAVASALALAAASPAADGPAPLVKLTGVVTPNHGHIEPHTSLTLHIKTTFQSVPPGGNFVLQSLDYLFPRGAVANGALFPSCSVATLRAARGNLHACPKGSLIGRGVATGTAVAIGVTSSGRVTLFNGPGGKSITMNVSIVNPALVNVTFSAPFTKAHGKYAYKLQATLPDSLKTILDGDIVVSTIDVTTGASRVVHGVKRGFVEAVNCPRGQRAPFHADFTFNQGATASADATVAC